ncbi:hypothetical protein MLD38_035411 [Melastoma candidum]|uniref:Uncharacterized protein n=1 Tax=Melastoma candidum TaxID=119954 RepID=A0ACB9LGX3_9MYRT|nr:hypothetical protein MLD38_035411 [Melastoma candidum]
MVCLACLLPLFLVPIVNFLPVLVDYIMAKIYGALGWEYRKPVRVPPSCPYKPPVATKNDSPLGSQEDSGAPYPVEKLSKAGIATDPTANDKSA